VRNCHFFDCDKVGTIFMVSRSGVKFWYCVEHYDQMAAYHKREARDSDDSWSRGMADANGW